MSTFWDDELYHHGVLGQKWGVRRYQNKDGTLTEIGKRHQEKILGGNKKITIAKGTEFNRVSKNKDSDAKEGSKLYVSTNKKESDKYTELMGTTRILADGKAFIHTYVSKNNITIPSMKEQKKIESGLLKDENARKEVIESLMKKGMSRDDAAKATQNINQGVEWLKATPLLLMTPINPGFIRVAADVATEKKRRQLELVRLSIGDVNNKTLNENFKKTLSDKGYNAFRDTNDRYKNIAKSSIILTNPNKDVELKKSTELTKESYGQAYANNKINKDKSITKRVSIDDLRSDGEKLYSKAKEQYVLNKYRKKENAKILKKHKNEL